MPTKIKFDMAKIIRDSAPKSGIPNLKKLNERHRLIMRLELRGLSKTEIADLTGYAYQSVVQITNTENYKETLAAFRAEVDRKFEEKLTDKMTEDPVREMFKKEAMASAERLAELRDHAESENVQMRSAMDILDRGGYKPKDVQELQGGLEISDKVSNDLIAGIRDLKSMKGGQAEKPSED